MAKPLSILILSPDPKTPGGVSSFIETMKPHLDLCRVKSFRVGNPPRRKENIFALLWRIVSVPFKIARLVRRLNYSVAHINPTLDAKSLVRDGLILLALRMIKYKRVLVFFHGWNPRTEQIVLRTRILRRALAGLLNNTARILVLAPEFKKALEHMGLDGGKIIVTRTMFDGRAMKAVKEPLPTKRRSILFMSRFDYRKGIFELWDGFAQIAAEFPDVDLIMAGDGEANFILRKKVAVHALKKRVFFPGYVEGAEKLKLLRGCTVFALPTYYPEGMPVVLLEAMAAGKPLLTTAAGGIKHIVSQPENGLVLKIVMADTVAAGLRRFLGDPKFCNDVGRRNAVYAWERFESAAVTAEIQSTYQDIARLR